MRLLNENDGTVTIEFTRDEIAGVMGTMHAAHVGYSSLESELINRTEEEVEQLVEDLYNLFPTE